MPCRDPARPLPPFARTGRGPLCTQSHAEAASQAGKGSPAPAHLRLLRDAPALRAIHLAIRHPIRHPVGHAAAISVVRQVAAGVRQRAPCAQRRRAGRAARRRRHASEVGVAELWVAVAGGDVVVAYAGAPAPQRQGKRHRSRGKQWEQVRVACCAKAAGCGQRRRPRLRGPPPAKLARALAPAVGCIALYKTRGTKYRSVCHSPHRTARKSTPAPASPCRACFRR